MNPVEPSGEGIRIKLHIQPRSGRTELLGRHGDALKVRLKSPPVGGAANEELVRFLSEILKIPQANVELLTGRSGRRKTVRVVGVDLEDAAQRLGLATG